MTAESNNLSHSPSEFWTVITDFFLSAVCAALALQLQRRISSLGAKKAPSPSKLRDSAANIGGSVVAAQWWVRVLWISSFTTGLGAVYHGIFSVSEQDTANALLIWKVVLVSIHATGFCLCRSLASLCPPSLTPFMVLLANIKLVIGCAVVVFVYSEIIIPIADYSFALLLWTVLSLVKRHSRWAPLMLLGVALSITASLVQILKLKPSDSFNHNDLYHVIQLFGFLAFYMSCTAMCS